jgi:hypothetical protein
MCDKLHQAYKQGDEFDVMLIMLDGVTPIIAAAVFPALDSGESSHSSCSTRC